MTDRIVKKQKKNYNNIKTYSYICNAKKHKYIIVWELLNVSVSLLQEATLPGMNAAIQAVTRSAIYNGLKVKGIYRG